MKDSIPENQAGDAKYQQHEAEQNDDIHQVGYRVYDGPDDLAKAG